MAKFLFLIITFFLKCGIVIKTTEKNITKQEAGKFLNRQKVNRVIILGKYDEFWKGQGFPKMKDHFSQSKYENQDIIIEYLKNNHVHMVTASNVRDCYTGETVNTELIYLDDGKYSWFSALTYYVETYNLVLPEDFVDHVIKKTAYKENQK